MQSGSRRRRPIEAGLVAVSGELLPASRPPASSLMSFIPPRPTTGPGRLWQWGRNGEDPRAVAGLLAGESTSCLRQRRLGGQNTRQARSR